MTSPTFGISVKRIDNETRPAVAGDLSVIGLVGTAPAASAATYPPNTPVLLFSDDATALAALGSTGTLPGQIALVNAQLGEFQAAARIVVVVVPPGADEDATMANLLGSAAAKSGIHALLEAGPVLGVVPRLIGVPGYTHQQKNGVTAIAVTAMGEGYTEAPTVSLLGGGGTGAKAVAELTMGVGSISVDAGGTGYAPGTTVVTVEPPPSGGTQATATATVAGGVVTAVAVTDPGSGYAEVPSVSITGEGTGATVTAEPTVRVGSVEVTDPGTGYTSAPDVAFAGGGGGSGAAATAAIEKIANPVVAALPAVLSRLVAHAVVSGPHSTLQAFTDWRETIQSERIVPVETWVKTGIVPAVEDSVGAVLGIAVRRDHENLGRPFKSWANQPVHGIVGPNRPIGFSLTDGATEGQSILALNGGVILRGEAGVESAVASGGFVFVGTDNAGEDELWRFYNVTRGRDYIHLMFLRTLRVFLGRRNLTLGTIEDIVNTMNAALSELKADDCILGYKVGFTRDQNSPEQLRLGRFTVNFKAEEAPVLRHLVIESERYRPALDALLDDLLAALDTAASATAA